MCSLVHYVAVMFVFDFFLIQSYIIVYKETHSWPVQYSFGLKGNQIKNNSYIVYKGTHAGPVQYSF
jgi:hypothetical protein